MSKKQKWPLQSVAALLMLFITVIGFRLTDENKQFSFVPSAWWVADNLEDDELQLHFLDVGQGDCQVIIDSKGKAVVIDAGTQDYISQMLAYFETIGVKTIEYLVISHAHTDHIGGAYEIIEKYGAENIVITSSQDQSTIMFEQLVDLILDKKQKGLTNVIRGERGATFDFCGAEFTVLSPTEALLNSDNLNNESIVIKMQYGEFSALFTGDAEKIVEECLINNGDNLKSTVLKVSHHGSETSSKSEFVKAVNPNIAVISVGRDNNYGHPHMKVVEKYENNGTEILRTDMNGWIVIETDGEGYSAYYEKKTE